MEIADGQVAGLVAAQQLVQRLWQTPDGRAILTRVSGEAGMSPEAQIAADKAAEIAAMVDARIKPLEDAHKARAEADAKADSDRAAAHAASREAEARKLFGLTEKGLEAVRELQKERGIADPCDAAELMVARGAPILAQPSAAPLLEPETEAQKTRNKLKSADPVKWAGLEIQEGIQALQRSAERNAF